MSEAQVEGGSGLVWFCIADVVSLPSRATPVKALQTQTLWSLWRLLVAASCHCLQSEKDRGHRDLQSRQKFPGLSRSGKEREGLGAWSIKGSQGLLLGLGVGQKWGATYLPAC